MPYSDIARAVGRALAPAGFDLVQPLSVRWYNEAVDAAYPLRGELRLQDAVGGPERPAGGTPASGQSWVEARLLYTLGAALGDSVRLGERDFDMSALVAYEPDRGGNFFQIAPRVMIALDDVAATGLVTEASRVRHRLLIAGDITAIEDFAAWAKPRLPANAGLVDAREARPEFESAVDRASRFLHLAALTTLLRAATR